MRSIDKFRFQVCDPGYVGKTLKVRHMIFVIHQGFLMIQGAGGEAKRLDLGIATCTPDRSPVSCSGLRLRRSVLDNMVHFDGCCLVGCTGFDC